MSVKFRDLTPAEKELSEKLKKEVEETRMVFLDASMGPHVPGDIATYIAFLLKELTSEVRELKEALGVKTPSLNEAVREKTTVEKDQEFRHTGAVSPIVKGKAFTKEVMEQAMKKPIPKTLDEIKKELSDPETEGLVAMPKIDLEKDVEKTDKTLRENLALFFDNSIESKTSINKKLKEAGFGYNVDKLIEMGYIKRVRMFDCSLTEK